MAEGREVVDFTNQIIRNQEFGLSTLHTRGGQSFKAIALQNAYIAIPFFFIKTIDSRKKFGSIRNEKPNYGLEVVNFYIKKNQNRRDLGR
jgi:hypothetical protein